MQVDKRSFAYSGSGILKYLQEIKYVGSALKHYAILLNFFARLNECFTIEAKYQHQVVPQFY